ncbi:energy-coupling factor transporter ATPase [Clostridium formicaceticum]|uniref:Energy-coupling factor transporter ATP-binding protein EcfA1 n=1 Tax=Clostridium formicaceticum TaxID=1497 RepID=A0AAC9RRH9_9CLOT|nr:energy-coupling factor transporter ATPase [Clostridium formicaceticum]AOY75074.1 energy-coupling factor transporter ATPase [Clostridium formicaceticum]ARE89498.1 Energy-coupling factor transporter ATP-binding protein EcfA1 [Clostridium formicaceticum]
MEHMIEVDHVAFDYKNNEEEVVTALKDITIQVKKGEFLVIIGHNGSGKSTLAKHMNALLLPTRGDVRVKDMNTKEEEYLWDIRQAAGMVFQNPDNQIVATIVEEDVAFGPENLGVEPASIRRRVDEALGIVGMSDYREKAPHLLSGGQKQRIAIAGVIAMRPDCIIFDEPTAMLDPFGRKEVVRTIKKLNKEENITIIHITHFMEEAVDADRVIVMEDGNIVLQGAPKEVFSQVEQLKELGLDVPQVTDLAHQLIGEGISISKDILTVDEMVMELCRLK